jgi:hypothetical protein
MEQSPSLQTIMNSMVNRIEDLVPHSTYDGESLHAEWPLIELYIQIDPLLADLFKQYQDAKHQLDGVITERGTNDPMTDVTRDMLDSARAAVATRYIELQEDEEFQGSAAAESQRVRISDSYARENDRVKRKQKEDNIYSGIAFMIWAAMIMEQRREMESLRQAFQRTFTLAQSAA